MGGEVLVWVGGVGEGVGGVGVYFGLGGLVFMEGGLVEGGEVGGVKDVVVDCWVEGVEVVGWVVGVVLVYEDFEVEDEVVVGGVGGGGIGVRGWLVLFGDDFEGGFGWVKGGDGGEDFGGFFFVFVVMIGKGMVVGFKGGEGVRVWGVDEGGNDY